MIPAVPEFTSNQLIFITLIFIWTGFVRTGLGFGGAALGLPLLLLVYKEPLFFLPIIGQHLLFFSALTTAKKLADVDWDFVKNTLLIMMIPVLIGIAGLLTLPASWMAAFVFIVSAFYALTWVLKHELKSHSRWVDRVLLLIGGYVSGASLIGAPFIVVVALRHVVTLQLRNTLFVLWFILVVIKLSALLAAGVSMQWQWALFLLLPAAVGHVIGLKVHAWLVSGDTAEVRRWLGVGLLVVSLSGLVQAFR